MTIHKQKILALALLDYHGGQTSGLYAVGSCMLSDSQKGLTYNPKNHKGHSEFALSDAICELKHFLQSANYPQCVTRKDIDACNRLAHQLEKFTK